jgi:hypothetical protein
MSEQQLSEFITTLIENAFEHKKREEHDKRAHLLLERMERMLNGITERNVVVTHAADVSDEPTYVAGGFSIDDLEEVEDEPISDEEAERDFIGDLLK